MKILHAPYNIVNIPYLLSREFRKMGHPSDVMDLYGDRRKFNESDFVLFRNNRRFAKIKLVSFAAKALLKYDVFQFHWRHTLLPRELDIPAIRKLGKKYFIYHHGRDVWGVKDYWRHVPHARGAEALFVSTPDLYDFVPGSAILIPQAINVQVLEKFRVKKREFRDGLKEPVIVTHAIGSAGEVRKRKGSDFVIEAVEKLQKKGYKIDFRFYVGEKYEKVLSEMASADIHIDQVALGWPGTITAEAMSMGTPVICDIRPDLEKYAEKIPLVKAHKSNLEDRLEKFIHDIQLRKEFSEKGREYVLRVHDAHVVARRLISTYNS